MKIKELARALKLIFTGTHQLNLINHVLNQQTILIQNKKLFSLIAVNLLMLNVRFKNTCT
jgi:hypothetical protein